MACPIRRGDADGGRTGPESPSAGADGSGPFEAGAPAGRAWLAALPDGLAAQQRVMAARLDPADPPTAMAAYVTHALSREAAT